MKVQITHLKAPWPAAAVVGDVVELPGDSVPGFFEGKCKPAEEGAEAAHVFVPHAPPAVVAETALAAQAQPVDADELQAAKALLVEAEAEADELRGRLEKALADVQQAQADTAAALERAAKAEEAAAAKASKKG